MITNEQLIAILKTLIAYMENPKPIPPLRGNGLLTQNKTEREYYEYKEKKEWLRMSNLQLNGLKTKREKSRSL